MSRRRDMTPTLERRDGQIETLMRSIAREQAKNRDLRHQLREAQRAHLAVSEQLGRMHADCDRILEDQRRAHEERIARYQTILLATPPEPPEPPRRWHQRLLSKIIPT
jgi:septal ring factor EnvC (AmiA/AmiB activator)